MSIYELYRAVKERAEIMDELINYGDVVQTIGFTDEYWIVDGFSKTEYHAEYMPVEIEYTLELICPFTSQFSVAFREDVKLCATKAQASVFLADKKAPERTEYGGMNVSFIVDTISYAMGIEGGGEIADKIKEETTEDHIDSLLEERSIISHSPFAQAEDGEEYAAKRYAEIDAKIEELLK